MKKKLLEIYLDNQLNIFFELSKTQNNIINGIRARDLVKFCIYALLFINIIVMVLGTMSENFRSLQWKVSPWYAFEFDVSSAKW